MYQTVPLYPSNATTFLRRKLYTCTQKKKEKKKRKTIRNSTLGVATGPCRYINYNRFRPISIAMTDT